MGLAKLTTAAVLAAALAVPLAKDSGTPSAGAAPPPCIFAFMSREPGDRHLDQLRRTGSRLSVLAPNWYAVDLSTLRVSGGEPDRDVRRLAARRRLPLWPVVNARFGFRPALRARSARARLSRSISGLAERHGFAGITLDLEEVDPRERRAFSALVRDTARRLHRDRRRLAVYSPRRTAQPPGRTTAAYDWRALARHADLLLAGSYNEHHGNGPPGPITTTPGLRALLDYAGGVSHRRVAPVLGAFGYSWPAGGGPGLLVSSHAAERERRRKRIHAPLRDGERTWARGGKRVWYETREGLLARARAVRRERFRWVGLFSLGREPARTLERMPRGSRCR